MLTKSDEITIRRIVREELNPLARGLQKDVDSILAKLDKLRKELA
jgi:hypothetical protein